jgi:Neprosin
MRMFRFVLGGVIVWVTPLLCGCIIDLSNLGGGKDHGTPSGGTTSGGDPGLSDAQRARKDEAYQYIAQVIYKGAPVLQSLKLASGDIVDGLDRSVLPALPYALPALPSGPAGVTLPPGVTLAIPDVDQIPELSDLVAKAAVFRRPDFSPYVRGETDATSIQDYLDRYEVGGAPDGNRLYAGLVSGKPNRGITGTMNQFQAKVAEDSLSILEFAVACPADTPTEMVGVVISVDKANAGGRNAQGIYDGRPRLHIEYANSKSGQMKYMWDGLEGMFVANPARRVRPGQVVPVSVLSGAQVEHLLTIFQAPTGDWWIAYDQDLLGYYPASLFTILNGGACMSSWYGEVFNRHPEMGAVKTEMGSGKFANAGRPDVAYVRSPKYFDPSWFSMEPEDMMYSTWTRPYEPSCYTRSTLDLDPVSGSRIFSFGGSGGFNLGGSDESVPPCKWPYP